MAPPRPQSRPDHTPSPEENTLSAISAKVTLQGREITHIKTQVESLFEFVRESEKRRAEDAIRQRAHTRLWSTFGMSFGATVVKYVWGRLEEKFGKLLP